MLIQYNAYFIVLECKNYSEKQKLTSSDVLQLSTYLNDSYPVLGNFGILLGTQPPDISAINRQIKEMTNNGNLILILTKEELLKLIYLKKRNKSPQSLLFEKYHNFSYKYIRRPFARVI